MKPRTSSRRAPLEASCLVLAAGLLVPACTSGNTPAQISVAPGLVFPQDLLGELASIHLQVFNTSAGVACSAATATATGVPTGPSPLPNAIAETELGMTCTAPGAVFCGTLSLAQSTTDLVFAAIGTDASGNVLANGCTQAAVNQEAVSVPISMVRYSAPAVCGDGMVEVGETCDPGTGTDPLCNSSCQTSEIELSPASNYTGGPSAPAPTQEANPFFLWPSQSGTPGSFFSFFTDNSVSRLQVAMSVFGDSLAPTSSFGPAANGASLFLPNDPNTFPPQAAAFTQSNPAAAVIGAKYFVAFEDDNTPNSTIDIHLRSMDDSLNADQGSGGACGVNGPMGGGEAGIQSSPQIAAGPGGVLFIVWQDESLKTVNGVTYTPGGSSGCGTLGTQALIGSGSNPGVAATPKGWVVAWQGESDVEWRTIGTSGAPSGAEQAVGTNQGQLPAIAALVDGSFAITWTANASGGTPAIFAQRYSAAGVAVMGDQTAPVNNLTTAAETTPAIASTTAAGNSYVVAWVDAASPFQVRARLLAGSGGSLGDGSGYLFNTVDGQINEFPVSIATGRTRKNPTVVVGGAGPYIAFGWADQTAAGGSSQPGIIGRRFPPPTSQ